MVKLIRFFRGWVRFRVSGGFPERFINLCALRGLPLWDGARRGECCVFTTWPGFYRKLRTCARGAGVKLRIEERGGLPFLLHRHRRRWGLLAGAVLCIGLLVLSSQFLWNIQVVGNSRLDEGLILQTLESLGVKPGTALAKIDVRSVERRMMMELDDLGWVAVNLQGSTAVVQVQERTLPPQMVDRRQPCNVVAARGGQIVEMQVYLGQSMVAKGDAVAAGDILVSGVVEDAAHDVHLVSARADIMAETRHSLRVEVALQQSSCSLKKVVRRYSLKIGSLEIPLWVGKPPKESFRLERMYSPLRLFGKDLPLSLGKRQYLILQQQTTSLTHLQAEQQAETHLQALERENFDGAQVLECSRQVASHPDRVVLTADYILLENIARQSEIFTDADQE